jgi:cytochrome c-type biogenesis protein
MFAESVSYSAAFLAGIFSFLSPCILPLIPAYFTFITGYSLDELTHQRK